MTIEKRNYVPGDFVNLVQQKAGVVQAGQYQYFVLDDYFKYELSDIIVYSGSPLAVVDPSLYDLVVDQKYTNLESGYSAKTLYSMIRINDAGLDGLDFYVSANNFGTMVDNEQVKKYVDDQISGIPVDDSEKLPGVYENKDHVAKVSDTEISIVAGSAVIRKSNLQKFEIAWLAVASQSVSVADGELYWVAYGWNVGETAIEFKLLSLLPDTIDEYEQYAIIGRVWKEGGVLTVSGRHVGLLDDPYVARNSEWIDKAKNVSVSLGASQVDPGYLELTAGEVSRWPIVELDTFHHIWEFPAFAQVQSMWEHHQGQTGFGVLVDNSVGDETDIATIADYYDNAGVVTAIANNKFGLHLVGVYASSNERVFIRSQYVYDSIAEAKVGITTDPLVLSEWASDGDQIAGIGWVILKSGARDFTVPADALFVPFSASGAGAGSATNLFALGFKFTREGFDGSYVGGNVDLPYTAFVEDGTLALPQNLGVSVTVASTITVVTFQFNLMAGDAVCYIRVNGGVAVTVGTVLSAEKVGTFLVGINVVPGDFVQFGFSSASSGSFTYPTATGFIRTAGA